MPRRRFPLRLHHSDSLLMLLAVLAATAFCWLVLVFSQGRARPIVAYTVDAPGLKLSARAAGRMLRETAGGGATASVVTTDAGTSIGVVPRGGGDTEIAEAEQLANRLADRLRRFDPAEDRREREEKTADELYQIDVLIRDAAARRDAATGDDPAGAGIAAAEEVVRLMRRKQELLALGSADPASIPPAAVVVNRRIKPQLSSVERRAALVVLGLLVAAAALRWGLGRPTCDLSTSQRVGLPIELAGDLPATRGGSEPDDEPARKQPRAA